MSENMQDAEVIEISLDKKIQSELIKANVTDAVLAELKRRYAGMKLKSLTDKESYLELKAAAKECSKVRNLAIKCCKKGREEAVAIQKLWVAKEKEVVATVMEVENPLDAEIEKYDNEIKRIEEEEKRLKEEVYIGRTQTLTKMGALFNNGSFSIGEFSIDGELVKNCSQDIWDNDMLPKFEEQYQIIEKERIEEQKKKDAIAEQLRLEQEKLAEQQAELRRQQEAFELQKKEAERLEFEKQKEQQRLQSELNNKRLQLILPYNPFENNVDVQKLYELSESDFVAVLTQTKQVFEAKQEENRLKMEADFKEKEAIRLEAERVAEEQRRLEELEKASDKDKYTNLINQLSAIVIPEFKSRHFKIKASTISDKINEIKRL